MADLTMKQAQVIGIWVKTHDKQSLSNSNNWGNAVICQWNSEKREQTIRTSWQRKLQWCLAAS